MNTKEKSRFVGIRIDEPVDNRLQEVIKYLEQHTHPGIIISQSEAIRFAIIRAADNIRHEQQKEAA